MGIKAFFGLSSEPGALIFLVISLSAGLCVGLVIRVRNGISRLLTVIAAVAALIFWVILPRLDVLISGDGRLVGVMVQGAQVLNVTKGSKFVARSVL